MDCCSYEGPVEPLFLAVVGGPGTVSKTGINVRENLLVIVFSRPNKNTVCYILM